MPEPTMADVAARAGVSRQLASLVLRGESGPSAESQRRVRQAADELGYSIHHAAQALREPASRQIGVAFVPTHATELDMVEAIYESAVGTKYHVVLSAQTRSRGTERAVADLVGYRCAALIVIGSEIHPGQMAVLARRVRVPLVAVGQGERSSAFDVVRSAGDVGVRLVVEHLLGLGHRRIAYIDGEGMPAAAVRRAGYLAAAHEAGVDPDIVAVTDRHYTEEAGAEAARRLLGRRELPTAVVAGNDQQAVGVLQVLSRAGVAVPRQVSLAGFDDSRFARLSSVDLTTARQDPARMGSAAFAAALRRIEDPDAEPTLSVVEPSLVVRGSTAPPHE